MDAPPLAIDRVDDTSATAHWKFWGTLLWGLLITAVFLALQAGIVYGVVASSEGALSESEFMDRYISAATSGCRRSTRWRVSCLSFTSTMICA